MASSNKKIRYAVVGQGWFAQEAVLPAFANATENSELAALVSGDEEKRQELSDHYGAPAVDYDEYPDLLKSGDIDAVYIVSTNAQHRDHCEIAARAGVHVLCEKPMAGNVKDAEAMLKACRKARVKLMIAYRLHFEEANLKAIDIVNSGKIGEPRMFNSTFTQKVHPENTRVDADVGGGPLEDIGVYCINAARYLFRAEPVEVTAMSASADKEKFAEVPEMVGAVMRFPDDRLATFVCGFDEAKVDSYRVVGTKGDLRVENGYGFHGDKVHHLTVGKEEPKQTTFKTRDHVGPEIVYFSDCILNDREPEPNGHEGLTDMRIIEAIYKSARKGKPVEVGPFEEKPRPDLSQRIDKPAVEPPELVEAASPSEPQPNR